MTDIEKVRQEIITAQACLDAALGYLEAQEPETDLPPEIEFNAAAFFDEVRASLFGGALTQDQVDGLNYVGSMCKEYGLDPLVEQTAYVLATVYHETAHTMKPIEEYGGKSTRYAPWYGRGYVQITWEDNYRKQEQKHGHRGESFRVHEDWNRALIPETAAVICVGGMQDGDFTGKALSDYIKQGSVDYVNARRIVNGTDRAEQIAGYARQFEQALRTALG